MTFESTPNAAVSRTLGADNSTKEGAEDHLSGVTGG